MEEKQHAPPQGDCLICMEDLDQNNYLEYQACPGSDWRPFPYCLDCTEFILQRQWHDYMAQLANIQDLATYHRLVEQGPPVNLRDAIVPCPGNPRGEVHQLWTASTQNIKSARLDGSCDGQELQELWDDIRRHYEAVRSAHQ